ncbi:hypothetical protein DSCW_02830 [Desulfosarcina widdelii]|uniref:Uncharacterized protein n=1 Tax=Desulfosarcina widdelii TaxID=947919 RepID=A0A5K7YU45_9BACT|nr:hypothetical protein [Desulfosarcina widdelii]BBO72866.1 hypothetical protein DSCW_02830 [Desulfosarcina widdelii]
MMTDRFRFAADGKRIPHPPGSPSPDADGNDRDARPDSRDQVDIIAMVRSLQRTAGLNDCFRRGRADCDDIQCHWRSYCLGGLPDQETSAKGSAIRKPTERSGESFDFHKR